MVHSYSKECLRLEPCGWAIRGPPRRAEPAEKVGNRHFWAVEPPLTRGTRALIDNPAVGRARQREVPLWGAHPAHTSATMEWLPRRGRCSMTLILLTSFKV